MSDITKAQKVRLGLFLVFAGLVAVGILLAKIGSSVFEDRDSYIIRFPGGVGGLQRGADVTFNGIVVGRVDDVAVDHVDVAKVVIEVSLEEGTPVPEDTTASVAMQGITGIRRVELEGGTNGARRRAPGEEIPARPSLLDTLTQRADSIVEKIDKLTENVAGLASGENAKRIEQTLANVEKMSGSMALLLEEARPRIVSTLAEAERAVQSLTELADNGNRLLEDARGVTGALKKTAERFDRLTEKEVAPMIAAARNTMTNIDTLVERTGVFVSRASVEMRGVFDSLSEGVEKIGDLADILRADPQALILGRNIEPRR